MRAAGALPEDFEKVIATNLTGTFMFCQEAARQMIKQNETNGKQGGKIIITASVGGFIGGKGVVGYGASKAGCLSLARTMANNFGGKQAIVNCICPGYVVTPLNEEFFIDKDGNRPSIMSSSPRLLPFAVWAPLRRSPVPFWRCAPIPSAI